MNLLKKRKEQLRMLFFTFILSCIFMSNTSVVNAQNQTLSITGNVKDQTGEPIAGATIIIKGTTNGTISDIDGNYSLTNVPDKATLIISFIGFENQEINVNGQTKINISLVEEITKLDEFVVVGYGVQKKSDVTGAMTRVGSEELQAMPVKDALQGMQGKASGVDITTNQRPGQSNSITIRGTRSISASNDPLYVVDGMILQSGGIDNINPNDIESIDILKDASATAIYGSKGANGVILVTTKQGKAGKVTFNYSGSVSLQKMYDVTEYFDAGEWLNYSRHAKMNSNLNTYGSETINYTSDFNTWGTKSASWANIEKAWETGNWIAEDAGNYDWGKHGKQTGIITEHTISASGGTDQFKGYGSFGYMHQDGTIKDQAFTRYTAKASFSATPKEWLEFGTTLNGSYGDQDYGYNYALSTTGAGDYYSALKSMIPWTVPFDENGNYIENPGGDVNIVNPINETKYNTNERLTLRISGLFYTQIDLGGVYGALNGLKYRCQFGPEFKVYREGKFYDARGINGNGTNIGYDKTELTNSWTLDNLIYYNKTIGANHNIGITLMQSASKYRQENESIKAETATSDELWYNLASAGTITAFGSGLTETQLTSYMIRGNYSFKDKYLLTGSWRRDGASQLSDGHKWANFSSFALGWRLDQENFLKNTSWIDALKLRLGYGVTGNADIDAYATKGAIQTLYYNWGSDSSSIGYVASDASSKNPSAMANQDLTWERTTQYNVGIDYTLFGNRIFGSLDVYKTHTDDLLLDKTIPAVNGYTSTYANVGTTKGWGIDFQINTVNIKNSNFQWITNLTWSLDRNEIVELSNGKNDDITNGWFIGEDINSYYDYVYDGIWKTSEADEANTYGGEPGSIKVKDLDNSGDFNSNYDKKIVGRARPDWTGGITNTFTYKNIDLSFFVYSRWGNTFKAGAETLGGRYMSRKVDYWIANENENAKYYAPGINGESAPEYNSSMNYSDGSFIKLRNVNLGYTFKKAKLERSGIGSLKIYAQIMNPLMIYSKCDFLDTDLLSYNNNTTTTGSSTTTKSLVFGIKMSF